MLFSRVRFPIYHLDIYAIAPCFFTPSPVISWQHLFCSQLSVVRLSVLAIVVTDVHCQSVKKFKLSPPPSVPNTERQLKFTVHSDVERFFVSTAVLVA